MRLILKGFLSFCLVFALAQPALAQENEQANEQASEVEEKGVFNHIGDLGKHIFPRARSDFSRPYMNDATTSQNAQWAEDGWHPEDWAESKGGVQQVLDGFYESRLVVELHDDEVPVLEVGLPFMRVAPSDQRRVIAFMDYAHKITDANQHGIFYIVLEDHMNELLGIYSKKGLQFQ